MQKYMKTIKHMLRDDEVLVPCSLLPPRDALEQSRLVRIPGQGGRDSGIRPVSIPK
jgi:hypothetical protein